MLELALAMREKDQLWVMRGMSFRVLHNAK
jgi:hypothetical protein